MEMIPMTTHDALTHFRGKEKYNCAQAILKSFAPHTSVAESCLDRFKTCGGGRSPSGECGALYAAKAMVSDPDARQRLEDNFVQAAGSTQCRVIRRARQFSCQQCVQKAADELTEQLAAGGQLQAPATCTLPEPSAGAADGACPVRP
jgi:coenzyme F420-reducing hydrogenase alpha subunit